MPHIDDGTLHAYLDGALDAVAAAGALPDDMQPAEVVAHLEQCADCRARLEQERVTRERAGIVLRAAAPARVHTPPLPTAAAARARRRTLVPLAWAASLVLAVGAGWWGSQIARDPRALETLSQDAASAPAPVESESAPATQSSQAATPPAVVDAEITPAAAAASETARMGGGGAAGDAAPRREAAPRAANDMAPPNLPTVPATADNALPGGAVSSGRPERAVETRRVAAVPAPAPPPSQSLAQSFRLESMERVAPVLDDRVRAFMARDSAGRVIWQPAADVPASVRSTAAAALVDAEVIAINIAPEIGARAVRVRQRLGTGELMDIVTWETELIALDEIVVTAVPPTAQSAAQRQREAGNEERAAAALKVTRDADAGLTLVQGPRVRDAGAHEMVFARSGSARWIIVRAPVWLTADDVAARLGAVSVASESR